MPAPSGEALAESTVNLTWDRVGGTERCGGPEETEPVTLTVDP
jgi:hypothetical protein